MGLLDPDASQRLARHAAMPKQACRPYPAPHLREDLQAFVRQLYRLRADAQRLGVWPEIEHACLDLHQAVRDLQRREGE